MELLLRSVIVLLAYFVVPTPAVYCNSFGSTWYCAFGCCYSFDGCCLTSGAYWYAWLLIALFVLFCLCACLGCGGYGYRRRYVIRRVEYVQPTTTVVAPAAAPSYRSHAAPAATSNRSHTAHFAPSYQLHTAPSAPSYQSYRPTRKQYQPYEPPRDPPPPYNPACAPPPYGAT